MTQLNPANGVSRFQFWPSRNMSRVTLVLLVTLLLTAPARARTIFVDNLRGRDTCQGLVADPIDRTPPGAGSVRSLPRSSRLLTVALAVNVLGIIWTLAAVGVGVKNVVVESLTPSSTIGATHAG